MKTAEVAIEHVLAGLLALCAFVLPLFPSLQTQGLANSEIFGVLGLAYIVGVVFDRMADTVLAPYERMIRLEVAARNIKEHGKSDDPFPQDQLEYELRMNADGRLEWMESLRSRVRTARELAVLGLPATLGVITWLARQSTDEEVRTAASTVGIGSLLAVIAALCAIVFRRRQEPREGGHTNQAVTSDRECRTNEYFKTHDTLDAARAWTRKRVRLYWTVMIVSALGAFVVAATTKEPMASKLLMVTLAGTLLSLLGFWAWRRITMTYLGFVART